ncbi:MAG: aminotransferase class I/II-fold pyridoxal phosphate-dependent enzyme [Armatimonadetes bacterium]|nr:aminotransferase class I/II-fold pyridoxal phosphate-dependent enzyme [Armatimonadota bacterium]
MAKGPAVSHPPDEALNRSARDPKTHRYDETPRGWNSFLEAAAGWYKREFGVDVDAKTEILQLIGSKEGLAHLAWTYIEPGDLSIVPNPGYTVYKVNTLMAGGEVHETPLRAENGFLPVLEDIPTDVARKAKLFYVCYPHNPTGATAPLSFYEDCVRFCREHDILLVNDMAYAAVTYDGYRCPTVLQVPGAKDVSIEFHSLSKTFNMTGWRLGFALGNKDAIANLSALKSNLDSKAFPAIAEAGAYGLNNLKIDETLRIFERRRDLLCDGLNALGWKVTKPKATFYVWARIPRDDMTSAEFAAELLKRAHIVAIPGTGYGSEGEGYIRMSLTLLGDKDGERFAEAVRRIKESGLVPVGV